MLWLTKRIHKRGFLFRFLAASILLVDLAIAQPIPGADDPSLQDAAEDWLTGDAPAEALWRMGEIAQEGNIAAQILVNRIYRNYVPSDFPDLDRAGRRDLLPPDRIGYPPKFQVFEQPFRLSVEPMAMEASRQIGKASSFEEWRALAERLRAAGMERDLATAEVFAISPTGPEFNIEIVRHVEKSLPVDLEVQKQVLLYRFREAVLLPYLVETSFGERAEAAQRRLSQWGGSPWRDEDSRTLEALLQQGRWAAIELLYYMQSLDPEIGDRLGFISQYDWTFEIIEKVAISRDRAGTMPTSAELSRLGALITADAALTPYLHPLARNCARYCDGEFDECMARGTLGGLAGLGMTGSLEPVISDAAFFRSPRGVAGLMSSIPLYASQREQWGHKNLLPQCLVQAAADYTE